jgi:hypothetical protein
MAPADPRTAHPVAPGTAGHALPRLVIAAAASSAGKTTVTTGLLAALTSRGVRAAGFKVGPDFIDPGYHALATGRPGRNLDPVMVGQERIAPLFLHGCRVPAPADIAIVEGVMGLFDGRLRTGGQGSTAHVAKLITCAGHSGGGWGGLVTHRRRRGARPGGVRSGRAGGRRHREPGRLAGARSRALPGVRRRRNARPRRPAPGSSDLGPVPPPGAGARVRASRIRPHHRCAGPACGRPCGSGRRAGAGPRRRPADGRAVGSHRPGDARHGTSADRRVRRASVHVPLCRDDRVA